MFEFNGKLNNQKAKVLREKYLYGRLKIKLRTAGNKTSQIQGHV